MFFSKFSDLFRRKPEPTSSWFFGQVPDDKRPSLDQFGTRQNKGYVSPRTVVKGGNRHPRVEFVPAGESPPG